MEFESGLTHVVLTCTRSKSAAVPLDCQARRLPPGSCPSKVAAWGITLNCISEESRLPASKLYQGGHWSVALDMLARDAARLRVWIMSAGYGLVRPDDNLAPYQATFSSDNPDSVGRTPEEAAAWWNALPRTSFRGIRGPERSIQDLVRRNRAGSFLVAVSPRYLAAAGEDLLAAFRELKSRQEDGRLIVVTAAPSVLPDEMQRSVVPIAGRLRTVLGGSMGSLNARVARRLVRESRSPLTAPKVRTRVNRWAEKAGPLPTFERTRMTDSEVLAFVRGQHERDARISRSKMHRLLRDSGFACEQNRFKELVHSFREAEVD